MGDFVWRPWDIHKKYDVVTPIPGIEEPPCKHCAHWGPRVLTDNHGEFAGVRMCAANDMHSDFSCYRPKESIYRG